MDFWYQYFMFVFQYIVVGVFEGMYLGLWQCGLEIFQEMMVEYEVVQVLVEEGWVVGE